jgi:hypothetical protein
MLLQQPRINLAFALIGALLLLACSVNVKKNENGQEKNVDIRTPLGGIHVSNDANAHDTGLPVYPGARLKQKEDDGNEKSANVNLSFGSFGLKVVALEYESDDAPEKIISFYQSQLKKYGTVLQCHTHQRGGHVDVKNHGHDSDSNSLSCEDDGGSTVELKTGTKQNQRIVAIEPRQKGANIALVRVQMHGDRDDTI